MGIPLSLVVLVVVLFVVMPLVYPPSLNRAPYGGFSGVKVLKGGYRQRMES